MPLEIYWTISDIVGISVLGLLAVGAILFGIYYLLCCLWARITRDKYYVKVYTDYPDMLLDRKWGVKYKKHFWNKWKEYKDPNHKYYTDFLRSEANNAAFNIKRGKIKV